MRQQNPASGKPWNLHLPGHIFQANDLYELIVKITGWKAASRCLWRTVPREERRLHPRAKVRPSRSASPDPGCEVFCGICACRRTILCHSGTRCPRLTRRRLSWPGRLDSASPQRLIPSCREPPRHPFLTRHFQTLAQDGASGIGARTTSFRNHFLNETSMGIQVVLVCARKCTPNKASHGLCH